MADDKTTGTISGPENPEQSSDSDKKQLLSERGRTLDQIKRLYAVIMGFAATETIKSVISVVNYQGVNIENAIIFGSLGFSFFTLMILFYLASERFLDIRYLRPSSRDASQRGITFDLICLLISASCFVILSQSFPSPNNQECVARGYCVPTTVEIEDMSFPIVLMYIYVVDIILVSCQIVRMKNSNNLPLRDLQVKCHYYWIAINFCSLIVVSFTIYIVGKQLDNFTLAIIIAMIHCLRFWIDFSKSFGFYYPLPDKSTDSG